MEHLNTNPTARKTRRATLALSEADEAGLPDAARLTLRVFKHTVAPLMAVEGVHHFTDYASLAAWQQRHREGHRTWLARRGRRVVGVAHVRDGSHLSLLFVDTRQQGQGIARALIAAIVEALGIERLTVNASPNAVEAYRHLGFVALGPEDTKSGIRFTPMLLSVDSPASPGGRNRATKSGAPEPAGYLRPRTRRGRSIA